MTLSKHFIDWLNINFIVRTKLKKQLGQYSDYFSSALRLACSVFFAKYCCIVSQRIFLASSETTWNCCTPTTSVHGISFLNAPGRLDRIVGPSNPRLMGRWYGKGPLEEVKCGSGARARIAPKKKGSFVNLINKPSTCKQQHQKPVNTIHKDNSSCGKSPAEYPRSSRKKVSGGWRDSPPAPRLVSEGDTSGFFDILHECKWGTLPIRVECPNFPDGFILKENCWKEEFKKHVSFLNNLWSVPLNKHKVRNRN